MWAVKLVKVGQVPFSILKHKLKRNETTGLRCKAGGLAIGRDARTTV